MFVDTVAWWLSEECLQPVYFTVAEDLSEEMSGWLRLLLHKKKCEMDRIISSARLTASR